MVDKDDHKDVHTEALPSSNQHTETQHGNVEKDSPIEQSFELESSNHINLTWRSWVVVFISCFAIMSQVFVVTAAGSVVAFITADLGNGAIAGWIISGPLLMQAVLSPFIGRLSDVIDRKLFAAVPPLIAFVGAVICAKATSMSMLVGGGILIGTTLATISIVQAIPSEVLPLKFRALANGFAYLGGAVGGLVGSLGAGGLTNRSPSGWRGIFWMQAGFHLATSLGFFAFYWPKRRSDYPKMTTAQLIWAIDPIGSCLLISFATLLLLALDWGGAAYPWDDPHVAAPLGIGCGLFVLFCLYEWKGRSDGMVPHVFFKDSPNFALSCFAFAVEGWIFYSAVNAVTPQIVLHLGWEDSAWIISVRQLAFNLTALTSSIPIMLYATKYKDLKWPLVVTYTLFLIATICYGCLTTSWNHAQIGLNVIAGLGQSGPLTLLVALVQFSAPHAYLSTATGIAFSARALGGAFGTAVLDAIVNGKLASSLDSRVSDAAISAGLSKSSVPALLEAMAASQGLGDVPGITPAVRSAALDASHKVYENAYNLAWWSVVPFVALALIACACVTSVKDLMTERVEATVEKVDEQHVKEIP